jgi:hypothetical protein
LSRRVFWWDVFIVRDFVEAINFGFVCPRLKNETGAPIGSWPFES